MLGTAMKAIGEDDWGQAERVCREILRRAPGHGDAAFVLGRVLEQKGRLDEAASALRLAVAANARHAPYHVSLGEVLDASGDKEGAVAAFGAALDLVPRDPRPRNGLGLALLDLGRLVEAEHCFEAVVECDPAWPGACLNLARIRRFGAGDRALIDRMEAVAARTGLPDEVRTDVHFALGKAYDDLRDLGRAFEHYRRANQLVHRRSRFDQGRHEAVVDTLLTIFDDRFFERCRGFGAPSARPILIVGMPRSGTTLVEQILAAHPAVHAGGELPHLDDISHRLGRRLGGGEPYPRCASRIDAESAGHFGREYLDRLGRDSGSALRCTDKMPGNFLHLGLAAVLLPGARVVHCQRDPLDTGWSIYTQQFAAGHDWAYDLADIGAFYAQYRRVMAHWERVLPLEILPLRYEALVENPAPVSRVLLQFCDLPWDDACLEFHRHGRVVGTASNWQVRQPLYRSAVGRSRRYETELQPLRDALMAVAYPTPDEGRAH